VEHLLVTRQKLRLWKEQTKAEDLNSFAPLISEVLEMELGMPASFSLDLMAFGAVYYAEIPPPQSSALREEVIRLRGIRNATEPQFRCARTGDRRVSFGGYLRVHCQPKRFPAAREVDWRARRIAEGEEYLVIDKPAMVGVCSTVDNSIENCVHMCGGAMGSPVFLTHRLDVGTSGVLVLAKTKAFCSYFNKLLSQKNNHGSSSSSGERKRKLRKFYKVLHEGQEAPLGRLTHYAQVNQQSKGKPAMTRLRSHAPTRVVEDENGNRGKWAVCLLDVRSSRRVSLEKSGENMDESENESEATRVCLFESTVELITGRTHQIRAQFAAIGCPVVGDELYGGPGPGDNQDANASGGLARCSSNRIGLQASCLVVEDGQSPHFPPTIEFNAGSPWWVLIQSIQEPTA
jgi:23S rRNA-/tRNA-specific pseudouridylate synthase